MTPSLQCLCYVIQAFAARYSDHPSIIGTAAPSLTTLKFGVNYSEYGKRRESFALAMEERALKAVDENGILRRASYVSTGALLMLEFLTTCK